MSANYETGLATTDDISAIVTMQEPNLHENGGGLSVRQTSDWFKRTMSEMPIVVARREGIVVGYALATSIAAKAHIGIVQTMLRAFPAPPNCYLYGPVCVAENERGNGLAGMMYQEMRRRLPGRTAMSFVRSDNTPSLKANRKMGKVELGEFVHNCETYIVFAFTS
ncbi:MAG: GNAT family N-acetyltransferase [Xanthobacteraceae bacterium]|jgi:L-amino acid N-acyltransferase YncA